MPGIGPSGGCIPFNRALAKIRGCGRFSSPLRNSGDFYLSPYHPEGCCKNYFCSSPNFTPCKWSWGMQISFFRSPNAPSSWMERFILRGDSSFVCSIFQKILSFFQNVFQQITSWAAFCSRPFFSPAPCKKLATGNVLTFLSPYSNIPYGKKAGRYQGLEFCRRIITRVTEESMWQR